MLASLKQIVDGRCNLALAQLTPLLCFWSRPKCVFLENPRDLCTPHADAEARLFCRGVCKYEMLFPHVTTPLWFSCDLRRASPLWHYAHYLKLVTACKKKPKKTKQRNMAHCIKLLPPAVCAEATPVNWSRSWQLSGPCSTIQYYP